MTALPPASFLSPAPLPTASVWPLLRALFKRPARPAALPLSASYRLDQIDAAHVRRYNDAFGFPPDSIPLTYLYLLAQRAQLATMLDCAIPFRIPGLIHVANDLTLQCPVRPDAALVLVTTLSLPEPGANGAVECILATQAIDGEQTVFTCTSRYLIKRGQRSTSASPSPSSVPPGAVAGQWVVALDAGRRYAALSGDWNPIHLWGWSARLMGMRRPIIHGMHTVAMACALHQRSAGVMVTGVNCRFRSPVQLGSAVMLSTGHTPGGFMVLCDDRIAVEGAIASA